MSSPTRRSSLTVCAARRHRSSSSSYSFISGSLANTVRAEYEVPRAPRTRKSNPVQYSYLPIRFWTLPTFHRACSTMQILGTNFSPPPAVAFDRHCLVSKYFFCSTARLYVCSTVGLSLILTAREISFACHGAT